MCRMLVAVGDFDNDTIIDGFLSMVEDRNALHEYNEHRHGRFKHTEGWGVSYLKDGQLVTERFLTPPWEDGAIDSFRDLKTPLLVLHARKATHGTRIIENVHPFTARHPLLGEVSFSHNGSIEQELSLPDGVELQGDADTEHYLQALLASLDGEDVSSEIASFIRGLEDFSGANCILATRSAAYVGVRCTENPRYYAMQRWDSQEATVISSEAFEGLDGWEPLGEEAYVELQVPMAKAPVAR